MASKAVVPTTPLRHATTASYDSSMSSLDDNAGDSGFSWSSSSDGGCSFSTSPATSTFSSSPASSRLHSNGKSSYGRRRASTSASATLESFSRLITLQEQEAEPASPEAGSFPCLEPDSAGSTSLSAAADHLQSPLALSPDETRHGTGSSSILPSATSSTPAGTHMIITRESATEAARVLHNQVPDISDADVDVPGSAAVRPALKTKLSKKFLLKGRERASSLSKLPFVRPRLERSGATEETFTPTQSDNSLPSAPNGDIPRRRAILRLQDRFARSAPSSPPVTPNESTDRVHLFRSRPSSIVLSGRGVEFNYFAGPVSNIAVSQPSSCNASDYHPALDTFGNLDSVDDLVNSATDDIFQDALPQNMFDNLLPREVRLKIFSLVVRASVEEGIRSIEDRAWTASRAREERWVGERGGLRALVKMSRVCREWRDLVFDGQLWQNVYISRTLGCDIFCASGLVRLASHAGSFLRRLDLRGFSQLSDTDLQDIAESCLTHSGVTSLTYIDLSGCIGISTKALHFLLAVSPKLAHLNVRGLAAVVGSTVCAVLSSNIHCLRTLDVSLCRNLLAGALLDLKQPELQELYACKLPSMDSRVAGRLLALFPMLSYLDLAYSRYVTDDAFLRWPTRAEGGTGLRGLRLSGCTRLTDQTCLNLAGKVPELEYLELASIGGNLRDGGLVKLIETCPSLRKIDLEDAINLSDRILTTLTPSKRHRNNPPSLLEHLNVTNIPELSEAALVKLVKGCPNIRNIEASNCFNISDLFIKTFAHHVKKNRIQGAEMAMIDCRGVTRQAVKEQSNFTRPRRGVRDYASRHFGYIEPDVRGRGLAECDESRIVVHSFWTWQQVDEAESAQRSLRTSRLAQEVGTASGPYGYPFTLRGARRASFAMRGGSDGTERTGGSCIVS